MLYCARCETLSLDGETCPLCGGSKLRQARPDDPVLLLSTGGEESRKICDAFEDAGIPHEERPLGTGGIMKIYAGSPGNADIRIFVPYQAIGQCKQILTQIGILDEGGKMIRSSEEKASDGSMSRGLRIPGKIFSAVLFALAIVLVVSLSDGLVNLIRSLFSFLGR